MEYTISALVAFPLLAVAASSAGAATLAPVAQSIVVEGARYLRIDSKECTLLQWGASALAAGVRPTVALEHVLDAGPAAIDAGAGIGFGPLRQPPRLTTAVFITQYRDATVKDGQIVPDLIDPEPGMTLVQLGSVERSPRLQLFGPLRILATDLPRCEFGAVPAATMSQYLSDLPRFAREVEVTILLQWAKYRGLSNEPQVYMLGEIPVSTCLRAGECGEFSRWLGELGL